MSVEECRDVNGELEESMRDALAKRERKIEKLMKGYGAECYLS